MLLRLPPSQSLLILYLRIKSLMVLLYDHDFSFLRASCCRRKTMSRCQQTWVLTPHATGLQGPPLPIEKVGMMVIITLIMGCCQFNELVH